MTRSDNPFGDLPEWKERQRLQEAQARGAGHPGDYQQPHHDQGYAPGGEQQAVGYPQGYENGGHQYASPPPSAYQDPAAPPSQLHYNLQQDGQPLHHQTEPVGHPQQTHQHEPHYDPQTQVTYPAGQYPANYQEPVQPQPAFGAEQPMAPPVGELSVGLRGGQYEDQGQFSASPGGYTPGDTGQGQAAPSYDLNNYAPGQAYGSPQADGFGAAPVYQDTAAQQQGQWDNTQLGGAVVPAQAGLNPDGAYDEDDDEYYDDEEDDEQRYSWKLLAAIVVTGAVVTGAGVVLYDSFVGGGSKGDAPIIRADQNPAKTAPKNAGGRQFANRDSKLLGRLDKTGSAKQSSNLGSETESGNRVRSVPTVKIGRDGRLILPESPKKVVTPTAPANPTGDRVASVGGERIAPGINVVDTLNGSGRSSLGGSLPPVRPKTAEPTAQPQQPKVLTRPSVVPKVQNRTTPNASAPTAAPARRSTNLATARLSGPPPVPSKSSVGSAWRMTSAGAATKQQPSVGGIQPTIARPVQPLVQPTRTPPATTRSAPRRTATPVAPRSPAVRTQGSGGYVAVLATAATRMKALQSFAELQQKHPAALQGRVPDVQRADLSARGLGVMYRVVVGPAGPRGAANSVCSSLKSAGYTGCWVKSN